MEAGLLIVFTFIPVMSRFSFDFMMVTLQGG